MASAKATALPPKWDSVPNKRVLLKNHIINFLEKNKLGWDGARAKSCGTNFVNTFIVLARAGQAGWLITLLAGEVLRVEFAIC